jgi:hypothetical protein
MKLVDKVTVLPVITSLDLPCERLLNAALESTLQRVIIVGTDADGEFYFASSMANGRDVLWWLEVAKRKLLELSE